METKKKIRLFGKTLKTNLIQVNFWLGDTQHNDTQHNDNIPNGTQQEQTNI